MDDLLLTLKATFGYGSFHPLQREIIEASLAGRDVFALLPTGGGKSLCFQLPALLRPGLTVVVSPLIALMKDQVDQLQAAGVAATYLNSSLDADESRSRQQGQGSGLGLAIVTEILAAHQGTIEVSSQPGQGSTFTVTLPLRKSEATS